MPTPVRIPKLGMAMKEATIIRWLVSSGDRVKKKQPILEIETEKIVSEVESPADGVLASCSAAQGDVVPVARTIGWILANGETITDIPESPQQPQSEIGAPGTASQAAASAARPDQPTAVGRRGPCSPAVRRLAREHGVDLTALVGSGPDGRILKEDVLLAARTGQPADEDSDFEPFSATRRAIAATVTQSAAIPQIVLYASADMSALTALHDRDKSIAYEDMLVWCAAKTLRHDKHLNASYEDEGIRVYARVNVGVVAMVKKRLLIPVIRGADSLSLRQISAERKRLMDLVRFQKITEQETSGGTFTITNLSTYPVDSFTALLNPPQAAILSVGRIREVATPDEDGGVVFRPTITFGLTLDHRVVDGVAGAVFLRHLIARIERPNMEEA